MQIMIFFFKQPTTTAIYTLSLHDALPISWCGRRWPRYLPAARKHPQASCRRCRCRRSEEHTSELQSLRHLVCRLLLEKKKLTALAPSICNLFDCIAGTDSRPLDSHTWLYL